ncbi:MAG: hypothetical protein OXG19_09960 [Chloroflexi bacterium]|nr:hypothetical protein [Chloroflexota bacterium]
MLAHARQHVADVHLGRLHEVIEAVEPAAHVGQLRLDRLQRPALLVRHAVHLLADQAHEVADVGLGEDVGAELVDDEALETPRVEPWRVAGPPAALHEGLADVVRELAALGVLPGEGAATAAAAHDPAEQVRAADPPRVGEPWGTRAHERLHAAEECFGDDRREGVLDAHGRGAVAGVEAPQQRACVDDVGEEDVHAVLRPGPPGGVGDAVGVEGAGDLGDAVPGHGEGEDALHDGRGVGVGLQPGALLRAVLDVRLAVAVGRAAGDPEAARGGLAHAPRDLLGQVLRVELVDALDDRLHELTRGRVVGVLGDRRHADAAAAEHGLEGDGVLTLAGEAREFPDEDLLEGGVGGARLVEHPPELGAVGDAAALGLVDVLAGDEVAVLLGVVAQRAQLGGDGKVDVLAVAGDARVERRRRRVRLVNHGVFLLICVCTLA